MCHHTWPQWVPVHALIHLAAPLFTLALMPMGRAVAQSWTGYVTVYADEAGASCVLRDDAPRTFNVYVLHQEMNGILGWDFRVATGGGFSAVYVTETLAPSFIAFGDTQIGISMAYPGCLTGSRLLVTLTYAGLGTSTPCSYLEVVAHPDFEDLGILVQTCTFENLLAPTHGRLYVNPDVACPVWCVVVSTEETTWGRVKALYRD